VKFDDPQKQDKFLYLMGAKKKKAYNPLEPTSPERNETEQKEPEEKKQENPSGLMEQQDKIFNELEKEYVGSMLRNAPTSRRMGLGAT